MDPRLRSQTLGGGAFLVLGVIVLLIGAPGPLGIFMIVVGMVMLGLSIAGHTSLPALLRERGSGRRRRPRR